MTTTGTAVHANLPVAGKTEANTLLALKSAVQHSWPQIRMNEYAATVATLATDTYTYSLSALTLLHPDLMLSQVYIVRDTDEPMVLTRGWTQYWDKSANAGTLTVEPWIVETYVGKVLNARYQYPHAAISALSDTLYLPQDYLEAYCAYWYAQNRLWENLTDKGAISNLLVLYRDEYQAILRRHQTPPIHMLPLPGFDRMRT